MTDFDILKNLCDTNGLTENDARDFIISYLKALRLEAETDVTGNVRARIEGDEQYTLLLDAHLDKIGFIATAVTDGGFIKCAPIAGIDLRVISSAEVIIYGKEPLAGIISCIPPHLAKGEDKPIDKDEIYIDIGLSKEEAEEKVTPGDFICFKSVAAELANGRITAAALDDRAGVLCLLKLAKRLTQEEKLPISVELLFSNFEELGCRGVIPAAFSAMPDEAIAIDVSFARDAYIKPSEGAPLGEGGMIGVSPVLNRAITKKLFEAAREQNIKYQTEVMGGHTGTNADNISVSRSGVPTGLISIPLRNMHTAAEIIDPADIESVCDILFGYIAEGGLKNA